MITPAVDRLIDLALDEDLALGDVTSESIFSVSQRSRATLVAKEELVLCGLPLAARVLQRVDSACRFDSSISEGSRVLPHTIVARLEGPTLSLLKAERTLLNFLQRLSGIATNAARYAQAVSGTGVRVVDTRKTTPGWRALEKYAVRTGGCHNHRSSLGEHVLIKDNHIVAAGSVRAAVECCRLRAPHLSKIECEVTTLDMLEEAIAAGADVVLVDNMKPAQVREAVRVAANRVVLEISGGVTLQTLREYAETGAEVISVGSITHGARSVDLSLEFEA